MRQPAVRLALHGWLALLGVGTGVFAIAFPNTASAQATEAAVKIAKPAMKTRLAPIRSPSAPAVKMKAAKAMV